MTKIQALLYLIGSLIGFAALSYGFYKIMVYIFTQRFKDKQ
jgi:hypothetical protein